LKFFFYNEKSDILKKNILIHLVNESVNEKLKVESLNLKSTIPLIKFFGINNRNKANDYRRFKIAVFKSIFESQDNDLYLFNFIDCQVFFGKRIIGNVINVNSFSGNDLLEVKSEDNKIFLIPINKSLIKFFDIENRKLEIEEIEGILDL